MATKGWTFGVELELSDCRRDTPLPGASVWDRNDFTIVNSNGVANDPRGKVWPFGGEINTEPTDSIDSQVEVIERVLLSLRPAPAVNYRSNLHVHIRVPGLSGDVAGVKRVLSYVGSHGGDAFRLVDPIPERPSGADEVSVGARRRWRRRRVSHHHMLTRERLAAALAAETVDGIRRAHAPLSAGGAPQYQLAPRCAVNVRSLWENAGQTVEFRHFSMSLDLDELRNAIRWCAVFLDAALSGYDGGPAGLLWPGARFPRQPLYDHWLETRYLQSTTRTHSDDEVLATIAKWREDGTLYECSSSVHREPVAQPVAGSLF